MASTKSKHTPAPPAPSEGAKPSPLNDELGLGLIGVPIPPNLLFAKDPERFRQYEVMQAERERLERRQRELAVLGARLMQRETFIPGHERGWLGRAKARYRTLGLAIEVVGHHPDWAVSQETHDACTKIVREFVEAAGKGIEVLEREWFLEQVDRIANRKEHFAKLKDAEPSVLEGALLDTFEALFGGERVEPLRKDESFMRDLARLLSAWPRESPTKGGSKYALAAKVWARLGGGKQLSDKVMKEFWCKTKRKKKEQKPGDR